MDRCFTTIFSAWSLPDFHTSLQKRFPVSPTDAEQVLRRMMFLKSVRIKNLVLRLGIKLWSVVVGVRGVGGVFTRELNVCFCSVTLWLSLAS